ncbi:AAA family ATPase [Thalassobium sp. R2A62]|uniref:AAA family ATPase n=1 Tax=Thalassobium sp. R2A62 TaxID=633131 RepID=UPI00167F874F|nr:AAA family ATPase [Thalassobium sp. R2A62]
MSDNETLWIPEFFDELDQNFIRQPDDGSDKFYVKLKRQLADGSDKSMRLMAEIDWILMLFSSNIRPETKRSNVGEVWSWSGGTLDSGNSMLTDDALSGLGSSGMGYNTNKWREITFAIRSLAALKLKSEDERIALLEDPWAFARWLDEQPDPGNRQFRHILLHLVFPDSFERISTSSDKLDILNAYDGTSMKDLRKLDPVNVDEALKSLRERLESEKGDTIDFYQEDFVEDWKGTSEDAAPTIKAGTLPDLNEIVKFCRKRVGELDLDQEFLIPDSDIERILHAFRDLFSSFTISVSGDKAFRIVSKGENRTHFISFQEIPVLAALVEHYNALESYREALLKVAKDMEFSSLSNGAEFFKHIPQRDWKAKAKEALGKGSKPTAEKQSDIANFEQLCLKFEQSVKNVFPDPADQTKLDSFISDPEWGGGIGKKFDRGQGDWNESAIKKTGGLKAEAAAGRIEMIRAIEVAGFCSSYVSSNQQVAREVGGKNVIYYGAPGTGKSYLVNRLVGEANVIRTVFHPDTQNSDFFGCLKPRMKNDKVTYSFVPGPFSYALRAALRDPAHQHFLVIEELNRAPAAAVFGELFQLLDRKEGGEGAYKVDFPNDESRDWYNEGEYSLAKLVMPSNLSIIATMNSADHGVYPLDTAFRRRWEQEYLPLEASVCPEGQIEFSGSTGSTRTISWQAFVKCLNDFLIDQIGTAEDRLLGQWFVQERELNGQIPAKILLYLWDDLLRHEGRDRIFAKQLKTFGALDRAVKGGGLIFGTELLSNLDELADAIGMPEAEPVPDFEFDLGDIGEDGADD